jgi:hypothetical protein
MSIREASPPGQYSTPPAGGDRRAPWACRESGPPEPPKPRLLDRVRQALRARHLSRRTEEAYVAWIRRFIVFHDKRHPAEMGAPEVTKFLTSLAAGFMKQAIALGLIGADVVATMATALRGEARDPGVFFATAWREIVGWKPA